jgi:hypothetical protein
MGDGRIFLKSLHDASFIKIYRMSLILTGFISLDSTFKSVLSVDAYIFGCRVKEEN